MSILSARVLILTGFFVTLGLPQLSVANSLNKEIKLTTSQQSAMGMKTELAQQTKLIPSAIYPAQATIPLQTVRSLSSPLSGQIIKLNYVHGPIKKGQVITEIESPELLNIQEQLLATLSDLNVARKNLNRVKQLNQSGVSSTKKLQQALSEVKKLSLTKNQHENHLTLVGMADSAIRKLEATKTLQPAIIQIKSPITGQLFDLNVRLGQRVDKNQALISIGATDPIILVVRAPVDTANSIKEGQGVEIVAMGKKGVVKHIDPMVDTMTQSVDIHISVTNNDNKLRSGQLFKVRFLTASKEKIFQVSANAISQYQGQTVVFIQAQGIIKALPIQIINITDKRLYFKPEMAILLPLNIYTNGSTAIKSALDAANGSDEG